MRPTLFRLLPKSLNNRLIVSFLLFILIPFVILSAYNFRSVETELQQSASERDLDRLLSLKTGLEDQSGIMIKIWPMFEQDLALGDLLHNPEGYDWIERRNRVEAKFSSVANGTFLSGAQVYFTLLDMKGNAYVSYHPKESLDYDTLLQSSGFQTVLNGKERYAWVTDDPNYVKRDLNRSTKMISLYVVLKEDYKPAHAVLRISMDYEEWFERVTRSGGEEKENGAFYALAEVNGGAVLVSDPQREPPKAALNALAPNDARYGTSWRDQETGMLYTAAYIPLLDWYLVKGTPLDLLFAEVFRMKTRYYTVLAGFMLLFAGMTIGLSSGVTRPLFRLQRKMEAVADSDLKAVLPENSRAAEEVQSLTRSFNRMVADIHALVSRLKLEERQKQAVRFQVLLSQMNPHFLLNTLNTVKSIALQKDQNEIHDICVSLGKLLESSLNLDVDLIHLKEELGLVRAYMQIQNTRFGNRFEACYEVDASLEYALVPKSSLQPLVENAIVHGFGQTAQEGNILIRAAPDGKKLILTVEDDGVGLEAARARPKRRANAGVGLSNLRERLSLLYQSQSQLTLEETAKGTVARLELPLLIAAPYKAEP